MSKRHQTSRRKTYGRRQHEVRERRTRDDIMPMADRARRRRLDRPVRPLLVPRRTLAQPALRARRLRMAIYRAHASARSSSRASRGWSVSDGPSMRRALPRRRVRSAVRARRGTSRIGVLLGVIVVAFVCAFFSLSQSVRVSRPATRSTGSRPSRKTSRPARRISERPQPAGQGSRPSASWPSTPASDRWPSRSSSPPLIDRDHAGPNGLPPPPRSSCCSPSSWRRSSLVVRLGVLAGRPQRRARGGRGPADIAPARGARAGAATIYDRTGTVVLATTVERDLLVATPKQLTPERRRRGRREPRSPILGLEGAAAANLARG